MTKNKTKILEMKKSIGEIKIELWAGLVYACNSCTQEAEAGPHVQDQ